MTDAATEPPRRAPPRPRSTRSARSRRSSRIAGRSCSSTGSSSTTRTRSGSSAIKGVTATEWFFQGHFPGLPVMPGVLQVEALAQTMAVYVAKQPGFGDRIGLFAGIDEAASSGSSSRATRSGSRSRWRSSARASGAGRGVASVDGEVACEATLSFIIPGEGVLR